MLAGPSYMHYIQMCLQSKTPIHTVRLSFAHHRRVSSISAALSHHIILADKILSTEAVFAESTSTIADYVLYQLHLCRSVP